MQTAIIIPALNEAGNIRRLIEEIKAQTDLKALIIVVNNGSTDTTAAEARKCGAVVIDEPRRGYGYACSAGIQYALEVSPRVDVLVFLDGDGSFDPMEMPRLLAPINNGYADLVLGSRPLGGIDKRAMPPHQRFGNWLVSRLMRVLYGIRISDLGPYRAIRRETLESIKMEEMTFGFPTEMFVKLARHTRISEVPVTYRRRWSGKSKVSGTLRGTLLATYYILGTTLRYAFRR